MKLTCMALDDEPLALDVIGHHASKIPFLNLREKTTDVFEAIELLNREPFDILFIDIQMPGLTGFELIRTLQRKPLIIFTTAYPNYALDSYELDAVDYLVKPISFERFLRAVNKAKQRIVKPDVQEPGTVTQPPDFLFVKTEYKTVKIMLEDILYIESVKDYVSFQLKNEKILSLLSMKAVEEFLPEQQFVRVHRSFIIAFNKIDSIERNTISIGSKLIPVGDNYREFFKLLIEGKKL